MMPRWSIALVAVALVASRSFAQQPSAAAPAPAVATPASVTQSFGNLPPGLVGTWLAVLRTQTPNGLINNWQLYKIYRDGDAWRLQRYEKPNIPALTTLMRAGGKDQKELVPTAEALQAVKQALPKAVLLPETQTFRAAVLRDAASFPPEAPAQSQGATFSIEILEQTSGNVVSAVQFYVKQMQPDRLQGDTHAMTIATAGLGVVPIEMTGQFTMYRVQ